MESTFVSDLDGLVRAGIKAAIDAEVEKAKKEALAQVAKALDTALANVAITLAREVSVVDRADHIIITMKKQ